MSFDFSSWAVVSFNDDSGLGRLAQDTKSVLGVRQLVIQSERMANKPIAPGDVFLPPDMTEVAMEAALADIQGLIMLERHWWHPLLLKTARRMGRRLTVLPTWEWFRGHEPEWGWLHAILCPSPFCLKVVESYGWKNARLITEPLDLRRFPAREVRGPGRVFFHNAGLVDPDDRKGTGDSMLAFHRVKRRDVRLIVRTQKAESLPQIDDDRIEVRVGNLPDHGALYAEGDVAIQPSKMEGIGFMVIEPVMSGVPTITLDYPPMSDHVQQPELRVRKRWFKRSCFPRRAGAVKHAHLRLPVMRDLTRRIEWCADHDLTEIARQNRAYGERRYDVARVRDEWSRVLATL